MNRVQCFRPFLSSRLCSCCLSFLSNSSSAEQTSNSAPLLRRNGLGLGIHLLRGGGVAAVVLAGALVAVGVAVLGAGGLDGGHLDAVGVVSKGQGK